MSPENKDNKNVYSVGVVFTEYDDKKEFVYMTDTPYSPGEEWVLIVPGGAGATIRVVWCTRIGPNALSHILLKKRVGWIYDSRLFDSLTEADANPEHNPKSSIWEPPTSGKRDIIEMRIFEYEKETDEDMDERPVRERDGESDDGVDDDDY